MQFFTTTLQKPYVRGYVT